MPKVKHRGLFKRCGHAVRSWPTCADPWWVGYSHAGTQYRFSLHKEADKPRGYVMDKAEARTLQRQYIDQIEAGTFRPIVVPAPAPADTRLTVGDVLDQYLTKHVQKADRRQGGRALMELYVERLRDAAVPAANGTTVPFATKPIAEVTTADVEAIRDGWKRRTAAAKGGHVGADRALKRLRHFFNWAVEHGHVEATPFKRAGVTLVHFARDRHRTRRLEPGEEARLLAHAPPLLHALIVAALETGLRRGELLGLRWRDVRPDLGVLILPAAITKTGNARDVPITQRLAAVLALRKHAPDGTEHGLDAHVFGDDVGEPVTDIRHLWERTRAAAQITGLAFHDLRREFGSRLLESGASPHMVRDWLGHGDLLTTSKYLSTTRVGLQQARRGFEQHRDRMRHAALVAALLQQPGSPYTEAQLQPLSVDELERMTAEFFTHGSHTPVETDPPIDPPASPGSPANSVN